MISWPSYWKDRMYRTSGQWRDPIMISFIVHFKQSRHIGIWINSHLHAMTLTGKFKCTLIAVMRSWIQSSHPSTCTSLFCNSRSYTEFSLKFFILDTSGFYTATKSDGVSIIRSFYVHCFNSSGYFQGHKSVSDPSSIEAGHVQLTQ